METSIKDFDTFGKFERPSCYLIPLTCSSWNPVDKFAPHIRDSTMQALKRRGFVEIDGRFAQITETGKRKAKELKKIFDEL
ncbi:MAG: hypothetical protein LBU81_03120 [Methanosarcinales archaeon]|nr:hypothetical protein [Methanosarcinales archaeon]